MLRCAAENRGWNFTLSGNWDGDGEPFPARDACGTRLNIGSRNLGMGMMLQLHLLVSCFDP